MLDKCKCIVNIFADLSNRAFPKVLKPFPKVILQIVPFKLFTMYFYFLGMIIFLAGCASASYNQGYQQGVHEQVRQIASELQGNNFPYYHWSSPIVQSVRVPAHLSNGVMLPEHSELVIIKPGEWVLNSAYPIQSQQRNNNENKIRYMDVANIPALPSDLGHASKTNQ